MYAYGCVSFFVFFKYFVIVFFKDFVIANVCVEEGEVECVRVCVRLWFECDALSSPYYVATELCA